METATSYASSLGCTQLLVDETTNDTARALPLGNQCNLIGWTFSGDYNEDRPVLIDANDPGRYVSKKRAIRLVAALADAFEPDNTVCLHLANDIMYPVLVLAILACKCRWTGTNVGYTAVELEQHFRASDTRYVISASEHLEVVRTAVQRSRINAEIIRFEDLLDTMQVSDEITANSTEVAEASCGVPAKLDDDSTQVVSHLRRLTDLVGRRTGGPVFLSDCRDIMSDSVAALMQTSGTTGLPKMAVRTHRAMLLEQHAIEDNAADKPYEVRRLYCVPIFHAFAAPEMIFNALRLGQISYFMPRFDGTFARKVHDLRITEIFAVPQMLMKLANDSGAGPLLQSLRLVAVAGAPLGLELRRRFLDMFEIRPRIVPVYGMTEGGWFSTLRHPEVDGTGSAGRPVPGIEVKIAASEDTGTDILSAACLERSISGLTQSLTGTSGMRQGNGSDCTGEIPRSWPEGSRSIVSPASLAGHRVGDILVKGPQIMTGYYNNEPATAEAFQDGWLRTGDIGYLSEGKVYVVDRAKNMIKVNSWQVSPTELENAILTSDSVMDAAVFGDGDGVDEHPVACVVSRRVSLTAEMVLAHLRQRVAGYKVSKCEVCFIRAIPRSAAGKVVKKELRDAVSKARRQLSM